MSSSWKRIVGLLGILVLVGAGCRSDAPERRGEGTPGVEVTRPSADNTCEHPYFPIRQGYSVTFKNAYNSLIDGSPQTDRYTWRITEADATRAKMEIEFPSSGIRTTQSLSCADGVLRSDAFMDLSGGRSVRARTVSATGEYLPRDLREGSTWRQTFNLLMQPQAGASDMPEMSAVATLNHTALREESVTVPSGTYNAIVVKTITNVSLNIPGSVATAGEAPAMLFESLGWWVRGVGLVKSQATMGSGFTATSEAESIVIP